ncbi:MAG: hypothetical protein LAN36_12390 [Acidobacteriia bacterium]|nr:hypothetical protein [Terriglobia bacterium]
MNANKTRYATKAAVLLGVFLTACLFTATVNADPLFKGKFSLTSEVHWGKAVLPAGEYVLKVDGMSQFITVDNAGNGQTVLHELARIGQSDPNGKNELRVSTRGRQRAVYSVQLAGFGEVFHSKSGPTRAEKEAAEGGKIEDIPIIIANK